MAVPPNVKVLSLAEKTLKDQHSPAVSANDASKTPFLVYDPAVLALLGARPSLACVLEHAAYPFAHEAGVYLPASKSVIVTSNRIASPSGDPLITVARLQKPTSADGDGSKWTWTELPRSFPMANGGVNLGANSVLFCSQGTLTAPSGLVLLDPDAPDTPPPTLLNHYHGRQFNSPNDVVVHSDGSVWFTDPVYGWEQGFRPKPQLPNQVYRFEPATGDVRVVADGFGRPNGICFSPDERTCYVTDTEWVYGTGEVDDSRASTIYAFDVVERHGAPFLANRRVFAMADKGIPDGIKCDTLGNVYSGCGDGLNIWSPAGRLLAKVLVEGGVANFCFTEGGEVVLLNETKVWVLKLDGGIKGALLGL